MCVWAPLWQQLFGIEDVEAPQSSRFTTCRNAARSPDPTIPCGPGSTSDTCCGYFGLFAWSHAFMEPWSGVICRKRPKLLTSSQERSQWSGTPGSHGCKRDRAATTNGSLCQVACTVQFGRMAGQAKVRRGCRMSHVVCVWPWTDYVR